VDKNSSFLIRLSKRVCTRFCSLLRPVNWGKSVVSQGEIVTVEAEFLLRPIRFWCSGAIERYRTVDFGDEREFLSIFVRAVVSTDVVWDIGASVGLFGVAAATVAEYGKVYSFEPDPDICGRLRDNVALNALANVEVLEIALGEREKEQILYSQGLNGRSPALVAHDGYGDLREHSVKTVSIDALLERGDVNPAQVVKIDVEGAEVFVLRGMKKFLRESPPRTVLLELHPKFVSAFGCRSEECLEILCEAGFSIVSEIRRDDETQYQLSYKGRLQPTLG
jgi:FkbM family methyltransferase